MTTELTHTLVNTHLKTEHDMYIHIRNLDCVFKSQTELKPVEHLATVHWIVVEVV